MMKDKIPDITTVITITAKSDGDMDFKTCFTATAEPERVLLML